MHRASVGSVTVVSLCDNVQAYPAASVYTQAGEALSRYTGRLTADGRLELNFGCFLVLADGRTVLVDTGWGPQNQGRLMTELDAAGIRPEAIDSVLFTHLHGDHTGWNLDQSTGRPNFPKARYLVPRGDWDHYAPQGGGSFASDVAPLQRLGLVDLIDGEHVLSPSLTALPTPGHTPGHTSLLIASGGEVGLILGDVVISTIDAEEPDWPNSFDSDHELARQTRLSLLDRLENERALIGASHLPDPGFGRFVRLQGRRYWRPFRSVSLSRAEAPSRSPA